MIIKLQVKVKPNSAQQTIEKADDGSLIVKLKSSPVDGKANQELIKLLAKEYQVTQAQVMIKSGLSSRTKLIIIEQ